MPKDTAIFSGGFLGLDNIRRLRRSHDLPVRGELRQADGTGWMALYCAKMMRMAIELALQSGQNKTAYEDMASKFLEHFVQIIHAINTHGRHGPVGRGGRILLRPDPARRRHHPPQGKVARRIDSLSGVEIIREVNLKKLPGFAKRFHWFLKHQPDLPSMSFARRPSPPAI